MKFCNIAIIISSLLIIGAIISACIEAWNTDTYDVTGLNET